MELTIREKLHWKERVSLKIDRKIKLIIAQVEPDFRKRMETTAREVALEQNGIKFEFAELERIRRKRKKAEVDHQKQKDQFFQLETETYQAMAGKLNLTEDDYSSVHSLRVEVDRRVDALTRSQQEDLMAVDLLGQKIMELQNEQENLLDTVWLATSPIQIKELWGRLHELLSQEPTKLQQDALNIQPMPLSTND